MQDSSLNPYIPEESQSVKTATETLHSPLKRIVKLLMIITLVLSILIGAGLFFVVPRTTVNDAQARIDLAKAIQPPAQLSKLVPVKSTLGFSLKYDNQMFASYAETVAPVGKDGKKGSSAYYENDDLRTVRDYSLIRITPSESSESDRAAVADPPQLVVSSSMTLDDVKANENKPDYKGLSQQSLFVQISIDQRLAAKTADDGTTVSIDATKPTSQTINGTKFQKVRFTTKNENYRITNQKYDDCYYTIQYDTPLSACITNVRPNSVDDASLDEKTLESLTFQKPKVDDTQAEKDTSNQTTTAKTADDKDTTSTDTDQQLALETPKPEYTTNFASLSSIAKNQPSVVRIGTLYCADLNLKIASGEVITTLTDACVGNLSSGTIVSKDGYIATTGHAIRSDPKDVINGYINFADNQKDLLDRLDRVLNYLLKARLILESDAEYLRNGAQIGDQEALAKIENIGSIIPDDYVTPTNDSYNYAIQPTDKPLVVDSSTGSRPVFAYSDTVLKAKFIAADYDASKSAQETFDSATPPQDVGILKADGSFQNAKVGDGASIRSNNILNVLGYPTFSDSSLVIGKNQNAPIVTNGSVDQTYEKNGQQLVQLNNPIAPGTDGGGTFNQAGELVGFGVYGLSYCPDQNCFSSGTVRSSTELLNLLDSKNMKLGDQSQSAVLWGTAVDDYFKGNYASASTNFAKAGNAYTFNRFATTLQKLADSKKGSASDTSLMNQLLSVMIVALITMVVLTAVFILLFIVQKRRLDSLRVGHYGAQTVSTPVAAPVVPQPQQQWPQQTQVSQYPEQQPASQQYPQYQPPTLNQIPQAPPQTPQPPQTNGYQQNPVPPAAPPQQTGAVEDPFYRR